ncbi:MAG: glutamine synthetase family protein [Chloroflexota bacterium]
MNLEQAQHWLGEGEFEYVRFEQTDLHGMSRSKTVPGRHFHHFASQGLNFFGGLLGLDVQSGVAPGTGYMDERSFQDQLIWPQLETLAPVPWMPGTAKVLCEPAWYDGVPAKAAPRWLLRQMVERLDEMGYRLRSGFEYEVYLADTDSRRPVFDGIQIFWTLRNNFDPTFVSQILDAMYEAGIDIITSNAEYGPGQLEINYAPSLGVTAADHAFTFKNGVKEMAQQYGYIASFMTKPYGDQSASGGHFHHSLLRKDGGENAFYDAGSADGLSETARFWIGGQVAHAPALTALGSPTVNCGKRYKLYSFAPMNATWGYEDRTAAIRVKGGREDETRIENRVPGAAANPYLAAAGVIAAGIDGIVNRIEPPPATTHTAYADESAIKLPLTLDEALDVYERDTTLRDFFGQEFTQLFLVVKRHEVEKARTAVSEYESQEWPNVVTDWERENFFEYL